MAVDLYFRDIQKVRATNENLSVDVVFEAILFGLQEHGKDTVRKEIVRSREVYGVQFNEKEVKMALMKSPFKSPFKSLF